MLSLHLATLLLCTLPSLSLALTCMEIDGMSSHDMSHDSTAVLPLFMQCEGQQCYAETFDDYKIINYYRHCISGIEKANGCWKYVIPGATVTRCYCSTESCNQVDPDKNGIIPTTVNNTVVCTQDPQGNCTSYECLLVNNERKCQNAVDAYTPRSSWVGYVWQNTCFHHRLQSGDIESDCRCNTNYCNEQLADRSEAMAMNESRREKPLIKCHFSFEVGGIASDKYFCVGELCALSEEKGVRTCVNITNLGNAEPIKKLGLIDFDNRTYYLCNKSLCNWNGTVALSSLSTLWNSTKNDTSMEPFPDNSSSNYQLFLLIMCAILMSKFQ